MAILKALDDAGINYTFNAVDGIDFRDKDAERTQALINSITEEA
jgi:hypothetical protein